MAAVTVDDTLARDLLDLLHDLAGHQRVVSGEPSPAVLRCAAELRRALGEDQER